MTSRLVFVLHGGELGGAELIVLRCAAVALDRGWDVVVCCPDGRLAAELPAGTRRVAIPSLGLGRGPRLAAAAGVAWRSGSAARTLRRLVRPGDVVVATNLLTLPAVWLARLPVPVVWLVQDVIARRDWIALLRLVKGSVDRAVAVSDAAAAPLRDLGMVVRVVPHGVTWPVEPQRVAPSPPVVGCVGLLTPLKGQDVLLEAVARLAPEITVELLGGVFPKDAGYVEALRERAARPDLAGRVRFLGRGDALDAMRGWSVVVSASVYPESGPLVVLEAMSVGVPVVATDLGGAAELLADGSGVLVPPRSADALADALDRLIGDPVARRGYAARGLAKVASAHRRDVQVPALLAALTSTPPDPGT